MKKYLLTTLIFGTVLGSSTLLLSSCNYVKKEPKLTIAGEESSHIKTINFADDNDQEFALKLYDEYDTELHGYECQILDSDLTNFFSINNSEKKIIVSVKAPTGQNIIDLKIKYNKSSYSTKTINKKIIINIVKTKYVTELYFNDIETTQLNTTYTNIDKQYTLTAKAKPSAGNESLPFSNINWSIDDIAKSKGFRIVENNLIVPKNLTIGAYEFVLKFREPGFYSTNFKVKININKGQVNGLKIGTLSENHINVKCNTTKVFSLKLIESNKVFNNNIIFSVINPGAEHVKIIDNNKLELKFDSTFQNKSFTIGFIDQANNFETKEFPISISSTEDDFTLTPPELYINDFLYDNTPINIIYNEFNDTYKTLKVYDETGFETTGVFSLLVSDLYVREKVSIINNTLKISKDLINDFSLVLKFDNEIYHLSCDLNIVIIKNEIGILKIDGKNASEYIEYNKTSSSWNDKTYTLDAFDINNTNINSNGQWIITSQNSDVLTINGNKLTLNASRLHIDEYPNGYIFSLTFVKIGYNDKTITTKITFTDLASFVFDRTFSITGQKISGSGNTYLGTGWLIAKAPSESEYSYYLGTNTHVSLLTTKQMQLCTINSQTAPANDTFREENSVLTIQYPNWSECMYYSDQSQRIKYGVDFSIIKITFPSTVPTYMKNRLNKLNNYASAHNGLMFNDIKSFEDLRPNESIYTGGYPLNNVFDHEIKWQYPHWEFGKTSIGTLKNNYFGSVNIENCNHPINDTNSIVSVANHISGPYGNKSIIPLSKHGGGASGSMCIDGSENLIGYYWGVMIDEDKGEFNSEFEPFKFYHNGKTTSLLDDLKSNIYI